MGCRHSMAGGRCSAYTNCQILRTIMNSKIRLLEHALTNYYLTLTVHLKNLTENFSEEEKMTKDRKNCRPGRTRRKMDCRRCRARPPAVHPVWLGKRGDACARLESQCGGRTTADVVWSHHHSMHDAGAVPPHATNPHVLWSYTATISCFKRRPQRARRIPPSFPRIPTS